MQILSCDLIDFVFTTTLILKLISDFIKKETGYLKIRIYYESFSQNSTFSLFGPKMEYNFYLFPKKVKIVLHDLINENSLI